MTASAWSAESTELTSSLRLSESDIQLILDELDTIDTNLGLLRSTRYSYRASSLSVRFSTSQSIAFRVWPRWINRDQLAMLHGSLIYNGTVCQLQLLSLFGSWQNVTGRVASCRYVRPLVYEILVSFDSPVDPSVYSNEATDARVLLAEDDRLSARILTAHLKRLNMIVEHVADGRAAIEAAASQNPDLVIMDLEMPQMGGIDATIELRRRGFAGRIAAITATEAPGLRERCLAAGCDDFLVKPIGVEDLSQLLRYLREEPVHSAFAGDASLREMLRDFVSSLPEQLQNFSSALGKSDKDTAVRIVRQLKAQSASCGFESIAAAARQVESALSDGSDLQKTHSLFTRLRRLCALARPPQAAASEHAPGPTHELAGSPGAASDQGIVENSHHAAP